MKKKMSSSTPAMYALVASIMLAIDVSCSVVHCSEFYRAAPDATVAHPDGSRRGRWPPAPYGNPGRGYATVPPPPTQQQRRLLHSTGRLTGAGIALRTYNLCLIFY
ncbi:hypothetical protein HU200_020936 [Digitaria exilis]|uniref:Secreted protein n=1 Tax=Digitaria exilis TaxID=1010633 RepID=A0A835F0P2_9POAL|nr:hypothetical protein HU200_020936 [Digitaria exilis]